MKKILLSIILITVSLVTVYSQVYTKNYKKGVAFEKHLKFKTSKTNTFVKTMPSFDITSLLAEDEAVKGLNIPFRFGKGFKTNLSLKDGKWTNTSSGRIWSLKVTSRGAYSINFIFDELYLSEGSELYIYNEDETMVYGPITSKQNTDRGLFLTDLIQGETVFIHLFEPLKANKKSRLSISKIIHAYKNVYGNFSFGAGTSEDCHNNVDCSSNWDDESNGVALVLLSNGTEHCTGSLVNNTANDYTPNILTAFHCIDLSSPYYALSATEISNAENWLFKYNFKYPECGSSYTSITFNGATYRAGWAGTDFALLEMDDSPVGNGDITYLGWDNRDNTPTSGTSIHHPSGDYMKISFENNQFNISTWPWGASNNAHWLVNFDDGVVEKGSSGGSIFNQNSRIVGQLSGNSDYDEEEDFCDQPRAEYGRFDISWDGDATNATRLSNWLDPNTTGASTTNLVRSPTFSGSNTICYSGTTYTMLNPPSGVTITWGGTYVTYPNGNTGSSVTVRAANSSTSHTGTITATFTINNHQYTINHNVWVGLADVYASDVIISNPENSQEYACSGYDGNEFELPSAGHYDRLEIKITNLAGTQTYEQFYSYYSSGDLDIGGLADGYYLFWVRGENDCGWNDWSDTEIEVADCEEMERMYYIEFSPNPAIFETTVELKRNDKEKVAETIEWEFEVYDMSQIKKFKTYKFHGKKRKINTTGWKEGVYIVRAIMEDELVSGKFIVKK